MFSNSCPSMDTRAVTDFSLGLKTTRDAISRRSRTLASLSRIVNNIRSFIMITIHFFLTPGDLGAVGGGK